MALKKRKRNWGKNLTPSYNSANRPAFEELIPGAKVRDNDGRKEGFGWVIGKPFTYFY